MILLTRRALGLAAALSLLGLLGIWVPWGLDAMLTADLLLLGAAWTDALLAPHPQALMPRREAPPAFSLGHAVAASYEWTNPTPRGARLVVKELRPEVLGGLQPDRTVRIPSHGGARENIGVEPAARGRATGGVLYVDSYGPLSLGVRRGQIDLPWEAMVYPPLVSMRLKASLDAAQRRRQVGMRAARHLGEGRMFESLREWVPGDDVRSIDWKATAKRRKVITRQYEAERRQHVLLVIDAGRLMTAEVGEDRGAGAQIGKPRMDYVVQAALELAYAAAQHDDNVGALVFADGVQHFVAPERGRLGLKRVLDVLAVTEPRLVEPDYPGAFRYLAARNRKRALTVLFTDVIDRLASEALVANVASLVPRHLPLAVTLRDPALDRIAALRPTAERDAFRKAAAEELLRARDEALAHMRRAGVLVLDVPPQRAAEAVVGQYRDLKRRGVL